MSNKSSLEFKPNITAAPIYVAGASTEEIQKQYGLEEIIKVASNENPLGPSPLALEAMQHAVTTLNRYPPMGDEGLRAALAESLGPGLEPDNFVTGNGGCDVLSMIATAFLDPGAECIICRPTFPVYEITARRIGTNVVYVDLDPEHYSYDIEAILAAVTEHTQVIYVCSPNNPTGTTLSAAQMETLVNNVPPHVLIVTDEVYHHFATVPDFPDSLAYVRDGKNVVIIHSFSKAFGLAGLRLGYGIAPPEIARYLSRARLPFHLSRVAIEAGIAGLRDTAHIEKTVELVISGRKWLYEQLVNLGLPTWPSQSNFILFQPPVPAAEVSEKLLQRGIIFRPMSQFYLPTHLRVTVGLPEENERVIDALRKSLVELQAESASKDEAEAEGGDEFKF
jgi:histidinol-phosphate aminotransferase